MSFCVQCGSKKIDGAKFCAGCGTPFTEVMNERLEPEQEIAEEIQEAETLENLDASSSESESPSAGNDVADEETIEDVEPDDQEMPIPAEDDVADASVSEDVQETSIETVAEPNDSPDSQEEMIPEDVGSESKSGADIGTSQGGLRSKKGITVVSGIVIALLIILQFLIPATISILSGGSDEEKTLDTGEPLFATLETYYPYDDGSMECDLSIDWCGGIGHKYGVTMTVGGGVGPYEINLYHRWSGFSTLLFSSTPGSANEIVDLTNHDFRLTHYYSEFGYGHTIYTYELEVIDSTGTTATSGWLQVFIGVRDIDEDGVLDDDDNCRLAYNPDQSDYDSDGDGDVCDGDADGDGLTNNEDVFDLGNGGVSVYVSRLIGFTDEDYNEHSSENDGNDGIEAPDFQYTLSVDWGECDTNFEWDDTYSTVGKSYYRNFYDVTIPKGQDNVLTFDVPDSQVMICVKLMVFDYDSNEGDREDIDIRDGDGNLVVWEVNIQGVDENENHRSQISGTGDGQSSTPTGSYEITIETHLV